MKASKNKSSNGEEQDMSNKRLKSNENESDNEPSHSEEEDEKEEQDEITSTLEFNNEQKKFGKNTFHKRDAKRLIIVLENACLETVKIGSQYELLNCDRHKQQIIKYKKDPSQCKQIFF